MSSSLFPLKKLIYSVKMLDIYISTHFRFLYYLLTPWKHIEGCHWPPECIYSKRHCGVECGW